MYQVGKPPRGRHIARCPGECSTHQRRGGKQSREASHKCSSNDKRQPQCGICSQCGILFHPTEQNQIKESWKHLMRWSRKWRTVEDGTGVLGDIDKVGGGLYHCSFGSSVLRTTQDAFGACEQDNGDHDHLHNLHRVSAGGRFWRGLFWNSHGLCLGSAERRPECHAPAEGSLCL